MGKKVLVLLSTYNGVEFIDEQLNSVLTQEDVEVSLLIRDDGSSDETLVTLMSYVRRFPEQIRFVSGSNIGVAGSFFELIKEASESYDYFAFCDQDDVWENFKLLRSIHLIENRPDSIPLMYCSATSMVDKNLKFIRKWPNLPKKPISIYNSLIENIAVGCTVVVNLKAMLLLKSSLPKTVSNVIMHDWWIYLCVSAFGEVVFDNEAHILYRQHSNNVLGGETRNLWNKWAGKFLRFFRGVNKDLIRRQATEFIYTVDHLLSPTQKKDIEHFLSSQHRNIMYRIFYTSKTPFYRQAWIDTILFKIVYVSRRI